MPLPNTLDSPIGSHFNLKSQPNSVWVPLSVIIITDTAVHTYVTDPVSAAGTGIAIIKIGNILGSGETSLSSFALSVYNNENQILTVQPMTNDVTDQSLPDVYLDATTPNFTVGIGANSKNYYKFNNFPIEYLTLYLSYATAPTQYSSSTSQFPMGIYSNVFLYYGD